MMFTAASRRFCFANGYSLFTVYVTALDDFENELGETINYQYLDIYEKKDTEFGQKTPVFMPDSSTRKVKCSCKKVLLDGGEVWISKGDSWEPIDGNSLPNALLLNNAQRLLSSSRIEDVTKARGILISLGEYHNASVYIKEADDQIDLLKQEENKNKYEAAVIAMKSAKTEEEYLSASRLFHETNGYENSSELIEQCLNKSKECKNETLYSDACNKLHNAKINHKEKVNPLIYREIATLFKGIHGYKDADSLALECEELAENCEKEEIYQSALNAMRSADDKNSFLRAKDIFLSISGYKDSSEKTTECEILADNSEKDKKYNSALSVMQRAKNTDDFKKAEEAFLEISGYKDAFELADKCRLKIDSIAKDAVFAAAVNLMSEGTIEGYEKAKEQLRSISGYGKADAKIAECDTKIANINSQELEKENKKQYEIAMAAMRNAKTTEEYKNAAGLFEKVLGFKDSDELREKCLEQAWSEEYRKKYQYACNQMKEAVTSWEFELAGKMFLDVSEYRDAEKLAEECLYTADNWEYELIYRRALQMMEKAKTKDDFSTTDDIFSSISWYKNANDYVDGCRKKIEEINANEEAERIEAERKAEEQRIVAEKTKKKKKIITITMLIFCVCATFILVLITEVIVPKQKFNKSMALIDSGDYDSAYVLLEEIGENEIIASSKYDRAVSLIDSGDYDSAYVLLEEIGENEIIASSKYDRAVSLIDSGDYKQAYMLLSGLNYKDSAELQMSIESDYWATLSNAVNVGDIVCFGTYEQDNDTSNGKEGIEWLVLAKEGNKLLVISDKALDCQQYETSHVSITWEDCSLRKWLNETFLNAAFGSNEVEMIAITTVTNAGIDTQDKIFLLSEVEVEKYFPLNVGRKCVPTAYTIAQGADTESHSGTCLWWIRSDDTRKAPCVDFDGSDDYYYYVNYNGGKCVRPAMWISLEGLG